jgi:hypothetical protein
MELDRAARIPVEEAARSGLAPDQVKIKEKYGGGYPANVEGLHHLHCLVCLGLGMNWIGANEWVEFAAEESGLEFQVLSRARAGAVFK